MYQSAHLYILHSYFDASVITFVLPAQLLHSYFDASVITFVWHQQLLHSYFDTSVVMSWGLFMICHKSCHSHITLMLSPLWLSSCDMAEISCTYEELNQWSLQRSGIVLRNQDWWAITKALYYDCSYYQVFRSGDCSKAWSTCWFDF